MHFLERLWRGLLLFFTILSSNLVYGFGSDQMKPLEQINASLFGTLVDHTNNHGCDRRIWSASLRQKRDLYIYLPPGFDPSQRYPVLVFLHGATGDEKTCVTLALEQIDNAMECRNFTRFIILIPDGSQHGRDGFFQAHSAFLNSKMGRFADYLHHDVWNFATEHYPILPEREAHVIGGISLGGGPAYYHAIKYSERYGVVFGIFPNVNNRWVDCRGRYFGNFDPCCWKLRTKIRRWRREPIGIYYKGLLRIPLSRFTVPLYGRGSDVICHMSQANPIELLVRHNIQPGQLKMFIAYVGQDEFNIDAQVESFLYVAERQGLHIDVAYEPDGHHTVPQGLEFLPHAMRWLTEKTTVYSPPWHRSVNNVRAIDGAASSSEFNPG